MAPPRIEIIVAAYNRPEATRLVLEGYLRQRDRDFSLTLADDGSGPEIGRLAREYARRGLALRHVWHEDRGYRRAEILNRAVLGSEADYLVFTDNDCIPHPDFVADHRALARRGLAVGGRRADLGPALSRRLIERGIDGLDAPWSMVRHGLTGGVRHWRSGCRVPDWLLPLWRGRQGGLLGANMAVWRADFERVNGFDLDFVGYGGEEVDLERRLRTAGVGVRVYRGRAVLFHLWHPPRRADEATRRLLADKRRKGLAVAERGLRELASGRQGAAPRTQTPRAGVEGGP
ncbi:glycosyltransferase [Inmirania thermothiophila]|uniref:glycosyltransferase n=1 Tax=Inmirania thermothiophila TaxID=1750597 RepID=UPI0014756E40|nr:glycosyltransferase [Inmirania thermothiophila]